MSKRDLNFDPPIMNAAGSLGFSPDLHNAIDWSKLGAFITNPISQAQRTPAHGERFTTYPGGFLLHTGHANPGLSRVLHYHAGQWNRFHLPVVVHLLGQSVHELASMARHLEGIEGVSGLEVGVSSEVNAEAVAAFTRAAYGELPIIVRLPMERAIELAPGAIEAGAMAVSLAAPRGICPTADGELLQGRLYGPAILPMALKTVQELAKLGIPTIGAGGIYSEDQAKAMLSVGALAVQLDGVLWRRTSYSI